MERTRTIGIGAALVVVVALLAFFVYQQQQKKKAEAAAPGAGVVQEETAAAAAVDPLPGEVVPPEPPETPRWDAEGVTLPGSDTVLRGIVRELSGHPLLARMVAADGLAATFVAAVDNIAEGASPAGHLAALAPDDRFAPDTAGESFVFSEENAGRYDLLTGLALSFSPEDCVELYRTFYPLLDQAYQELGYPDADFHRAFTGAVRHLLRTPEPEGPALLVRKVTTYAYADPRLESLSPAQKQLLRTGPDNVRRIRQWLAEVERLLLAAPAAADRSTPP
jgi:hypothetical protein